MPKHGLENCNCGSGQYAPQRLDGHGIFLTYACDACWPEKLKKYRPDIMQAYDACEDIDSD